MVLLLLGPAATRIQSEPAAAQSDACPSELVHMGQRGGPLNGLVVNGDAAYVAIGRHIEVVDLGGTADVPSSEGHALPLVETLELPGAVSQMVLSSDGALLVVAMTAVSELWVFDVDDALAPQLRNRVALREAPLAMAVGESHAYVFQYGLLLAIDIRPGAAKPVAGRLATANSAVMVLHGDRLFSASFEIDISSGQPIPTAEGLNVVDVSNPEAPVDLGFVAMLPAHSSIEDVAFVGDVVFVASRAQGLETFDMSDPLRPRPLGSLKAAASGHVRVVANEHTAVAIGGHVHDVDLLDARDPARLVWAGGFASGAAHDQPRLQLNGERLVVAIDGALHAYHVGVPAKPELVGVYHTLGGRTRIIDARAGSALVGTNEGIVAVDASEPFDLHPTSYAQTRWSPEGMARDGDGAYVTSAGPISVQVGDRTVSGLATAIDALDLRDSGNLQDIARLLVPGFPQSIAARSSVAWASIIDTDVWGGEEGAPVDLYAFDVTDPLAPTLVGEPLEDVGGSHLSLDGGCLVSLGGYGYSGRHARLELIDVSTPSEPRLVRRLAERDGLPRTSIGMSASGGLVYLTTDREGLVVLGPERPPAPSWPSGTRVALPIGWR